MKQHIARTIVAAAILSSAAFSQAEIRSATKEIVIEQPADLPEQAQRPGQDLLLHQDGHGSTYLYVEQQEGRRLAVFNVTDPAHMRYTASVATGAAREYDFIREAGNNVELVRYRDGSGMGLLNLRHAETPTLTAAPRLNEGDLESLGSGIVLISAASPAHAIALPVDEQPGAQKNIAIFDTISVSPRLLTTVSDVSKRVERSETGTIFLLGKDGITEVRHPAAETAYENLQHMEEQN
jgi:hypothetical protein